MKFLKYGDFGFAIAISEFIFSLTLMKTFTWITPQDGGRVYVPIGIASEKTEERIMIAFIIFWLHLVFLLPVWILYTREVKNQ